MVMAQLRYSGMLETIRVRKAGFTGRTTFEDFIKRYGITVPDIGRTPNKGDACKKILGLCGSACIQGSHWQIGVTKVFMKANVETALEALRAEKIMVHIIKIQSFMRMAYQKTRLKKIKKNAVKMQKVIRGFIGRVKARKRTKAVLTYQSGILL